MHKVLFLVANQSIFIVFLKQLSLLNYKNLAQIEFDFDAKINCFVGKNGVGKTNILDAIYHLAYGKSYFNPLAVQNIRHGEEFFVIDGEFEKQNRPEQIVCSLKKGSKKMKVYLENNRVGNSLICSSHICSNRSRQMRECE